MDRKEVVSLIKDTIHSWTEDKVPRLGAALAFYSALSLAPLLIIAIAVAAFAFPDEATARGRLIVAIEGLVGKQGGEAIRTVITNAREPGISTVASALGVITLLIGASGVFGAVQDSLNTIWEVAPKPGRGLRGLIKDRFLSFTMVLGVGFLLLISLVITTVLEALGAYFGGMLTTWTAPLQAFNLIVSFAVVTFLFAMIFKYLPDAKISWSNVWLGSVVTAFLFMVGKYAIGLYLGRSTIGSAYGAAGSFVVLLVWIYYSAQILFLGAEFTKVYAAHQGARITPADNAKPVTEEARAQEGIPHESSSAPEVVAAGLRPRGADQAGT